MFDQEKHRQRVQWFVNDRFGLFIHWGLYAIPARGEWVRHFEKISDENYQPYFEEFNPVDFNPQAWARTAKEAGMKYAVLTAKHHDGFCLFDSQLTDYKSTNTPCGRDLVREYLDAFRAEGIKVGLYYSLIDWHHPDYPHYGHSIHPMRENPVWQGQKHTFENYLCYLHGQVEELCTSYGKIDILWFDFSYGDLVGEAWKATELVRMIRQHQPQVLIDNRLEVSGTGFGSLLTDHPNEYAGDFVSPEQIVPPQGIRDEAGNPVVWEACVTMNNHWGYCERDIHFKSADMIVKKLVECVSKGGNLLVNIGPDARGNIPPQSIDILRGVGQWMSKNADSITGCTGEDGEKPEYGRITAKGNKRFYHITESPIGYVPLPGIRREQVEKVRLLATGAELAVASDGFTNNFPDVVFVTLGESPELPDAMDTVIEVTLRG